MFLTINDGHYLDNHPTAFVMAIYSGLLSGPLNAAISAILIAACQGPLFARLPASGLVQVVLEATFGATVFVLLLVQLLTVTRVRVGSTHWDGPGRVLLFPCRTSHSRLFPKKHSFSYPYLTVGIPVGFEGNAGGVVSVEAKGKPCRTSWFYPAHRMPRAWYTIDPDDYLERGQPELGLREKLDTYLQTQGVDPASYPYAYLVTAARFLGYNFNPVSFWYMYDAEKLLTAMILEVNNTFDERRMYFLTPDDDPASQSGGRLKTEADLGECPPQPSRCRRVFTQSWPKDFHVSPFNSRKGSYAVRASDPLSPSPHDTRPISINITLISSKGHPKLVASLTTTGAPIDPHTMTSYQKLRFLSSWWHVGFLTLPRILAQAARLFFQHKLLVWYRPEPLKGTISRHATKTEQQLEPIFRRYLQHLVDQTSAPLSIIYTAPAGMDQASSAGLMLSPAARELQKQQPAGKVMKTTAEGVETLELRVLTPAFYTRFVRNHHADALDALTSELDEGRAIWVSRRELLAKLAMPDGRTGSSSSGLSKREAEAEAEGKSEGLQDGCFWLIRLLRVGSRLGRVQRLLSLEKMPLSGGRDRAVLDRGGKAAAGGGAREEGVSEMDAYVLRYEGDKAREVYTGCVLRVLLADRAAFGSVGLLRVQAVVVQACLVWVLSSVLLEAVGR